MHRIAARLAGPQSGRVRLEERKRCRLVRARDSAEEHWATATRIWRGCEREGTHPYQSVRACANEGIPPGTLHVPNVFWLLPIQDVLARLDV